MTQFRDDWAFGLSINTPFGSRTQYDDDWVGRYHGVESNILAVNINPNLAYQVNERFSVGFGINAQYFDATLSSKAPTPDPTTDAEVEIEGDSWSAGLNAGFLYDVTENTQLGFSWRSQIKHNISNGDLTFDGGGIAPDDEGSGRAAIELPESYTLSMKHTPTFEERLTVLADVALTRWSRVDTVSVRPDGTFAPAAGGLGEEELSAVLDFQDSWRGSIGATWDQTERLQLRTGFQFDQSAVKDSERRTVRVPDNHRRWLSVGAGYRFNNGLELDGSYSRLFISDTKINNENANGQRLEGEFDSSADIFTVQLTYRY